MRLIYDDVEKTYNPNLDRVAFSKDFQRYYVSQQPNTSENPLRMQHYEVGSLTDMATTRKV